MKGYRKVITAIVFVLIAWGTSYIVPIDYYTPFLDFLKLVAGAFLLANGIEHIGDGIGGRNGISKENSE